MKLQGKKIANMKKFQEYFVLQEVILGFHQFLRDFSPENIFYECDRDRELYRFIKDSRQKPGTEAETEFSIGYREDGGTNRGDGGTRRIVLWERKGKEAPVSIGLEYQDQEQMEKMAASDLVQRQPRLAAGIVALCELAHYPCQVKEVEEFITLEQIFMKDNAGFDAYDGENAPAGEESTDGVYETDQGIIFTASAVGYRLNRWIPSAREQAIKITTKRLFRQSYSKYAGGIELTVADGSGDERYFEKRGLENEVYANFIGDGLIEFLPQESLNGPYRIYKDWGPNGKVLLKRDKDGKLQNVYQDADGELARMSCFAAAKDGGFAGISGGKLLGYTSEVKLPALHGEKPVYLCLKNGLYVILTETGHTIANFNFNFQNVCMIRMDGEGYAYGLLTNGHVVTNHPGKKAALESLANVVSIDCREGAEDLILCRMPDPVQNV